MTKSKILVVDHDQREFERLANWLVEYELTSALGGPQAIELLTAVSVVLAIVRWDLEGPWTGLETMVRLRERVPGLPVIMTFQEIDLGRVSIARRNGAVDFLLKPLLKGRVQSSVASSVEPATRPRLFPQLNARLIGESPRFLSMLEKLARAVERQKGPILLIGENGTGKDEIARAIHAVRDNPNESMVTVNMAALNRDLIESELFGHVKGAFTYAHEHKAGFFSICDGGTMFLNEIGEFDLSLQAKLLQVIEYGTFRAVGSTEEQRLNARLVFATNKDLDAEVQQGNFRKDLYHRISGAEFRIPPLRERGDDLWLLTEHFLTELSDGRRLRLARETKVILRGHDFPGNIRELRRLIETSVAQCDSEEITPAHLPLEVMEGRQVPPEAVIDSNGRFGWPAELLALPYKLALAELQRAFSRDYLERKLDAADKNMSRAAELAGIDRKTFREKLRDSQSSVKDSKRS